MIDLKKKVELLFISLSFWVRLMLSLYLRPISFPLDVHVTPQQIIHPSYQFIKYESLTKDPYLDPLNN